MIPKVIHYCWFGGNPLPPLAEKCIASWKKFLPNYEIKEWNEQNFDVNIIPYTAEAYQAKKYAFVSDYARFWILYHYGGLYFDTDVEVIKPMGNIIAKGAFMGCEQDAKPGKELTVNPGLGLAVESKHEIYKAILEEYDSFHFLNEDGSNNDKTVVEYVTEILKKHGLRNSPGIQNINGINVYPSEYFCPRNTVTKRMHITNNTYTIHHYMASWKDGGFNLKKIIRKFIPESVLLWYNKRKG